MQFRAVKGMNDILPGEVERWQRFESTFRRTVELCGYSEVRTPVLESRELFVRSTGETTEIVEKQMFELERSGERLALRPEGTPGSARAFVAGSVHAREPVTRWYYLGPMFRAEQPQRGRYRQFHQAGCELYGDKGPVADAEMIDMLVGLLAELGIDQIDVRINSLGGTESRAKYREALLGHLRPRAAELSDHARRRLEDNPLRILDSKDPRDRAAVEGAPSILDVLEPEDSEHFGRLRSALDALGTPYQLDPGLVRGLDYYNRTLFEFSSTSGSLGTQNALLGGGRYDGMLKSLGGPDLPSIGFGMGIERILLAMPETQPAPAPSVFVAPMGGQAAEAGLRVARELRRAGIRTELDGRGGSLKSLLRRADALHAKLCLVLGESELARGVVQIKDLAAHQQTEVALGELLAHVQATLGREEALH